MKNLVTLTVKLSKRFCKNSIRRILDNEKYYGLTVEAGKVVDEIANADFIDIIKGTNDGKHNAEKKSLAANYFDQYYNEVSAVPEVKKLTDKEIENYYKNMENDIEVSHILITPQVTDKMNDDEKKKAETEAETKAKSIITELKDAVKKGSSVTDAFSELAKKYSEHESTKDKGGSLGEVNKTTLGDSYTNLINKAYTLKDGAYSTEAIKTDNGYHVIMRNKTYDKKDLKDVKQQIIETLAKEKMEKDNTISVNALQHYRKEKGMEIEDSTLATQYSNYISNTLASLTQEKNNTTK